MSTGFRSPLFGLATAPTCLLCVLPAVKWQDVHAEFVAAKAGIEFHVGDRLQAFSGVDGLWHEARIAEIKDSSTHIIDGATAIGSIGGTIK